MVFMWVCMGNEEIIQHENLTPHHLVKAKPCTYICYLETAKIISNIYIAWKYFFIFVKKKLRHWSICCFSKKLMVAKPMAPHSSTLAWKIPWMEEPGRLQSMGSLRVGHD